MSALDGVIKFRQLENMEKQANQEAVMSVFGTFQKAQQTSQLLDMEKKKLDVSLGKSGLKFGEGGEIEANESLLDSLGKGIKPKTFSRSEIAGTGTSPGLKTSAIVGGETVPVRPFVERKKENYDKLSPVELTELYETDNDLEAKDEYDKRLTEAHRDISLVIEQGPEEGESEEDFKARIEQAIQADGWTLEEFPKISIKTH